MEPFIGEIKIFGFGYAPRGWAACDGQLLSISQNQALFSLLGTTYGGDGIQTFALPNLKGRAPVQSSPRYRLGITGGEEFHTLTVQELPAHTHQASASSAAPDQASPENNFWTADTDGKNFYAPTANATMAGGALQPTGGLGHENRPPFLTLNICIAINGVFPPRP